MLQNQRALFWQGMDNVDTLPMPEHAISKCALEDSETALSRGKSSLSLSLGAEASIPKPVPLQATAESEPVPEQVPSKKHAEVEPAEPNPVPPSQPRPEETVGPLDGVETFPVVKKADQQTFQGRRQTAKPKESNSKEKAKNATTKAALKRPAAAKPGASRPKAKAKMAAPVVTTPAAESAVASDGDGSMIAEVGSSSESPRNLEPELDAAASDPELEPKQPKSKEGKRKAADQKIQGDGSKGPRSKTMKQSTSKKADTAGANTGVEAIMPPHVPEAAAFCGNVMDLLDKKTFAGRNPPKQQDSLNRFTALVETFVTKIQCQITTTTKTEAGPADQKCTHTYTHICI